MQNFKDITLHIFIICSLGFSLLFTAFLIIDAEPHTEEKQGAVMYRHELYENDNYNQPSAVPSVNAPENEDKNIEPEIHEGYWLWAQVTAYCPCKICCGKTPDDPAYGITSRQVNVLSGDPNDAYGIAADPRAIPYGTFVYIPGYWESIQNNKTFVPTQLPYVDDTGGAMRQSWEQRGVIHLDVRYRTHKAARTWGVRMMQVFVYE